ncbi:VIR protein [Plasmodium vivax]|uniref:VIR protein n=1 Tax=Plasmodium vivax TaxID=5855 RepID=A0A1G4E1G9_PLAVI|nr:VIR protein [Plasmodium vivax]
MSLTSSTFKYTPIAIAEGYDFLNKLPLFKFYDELKSISTTQNNNRTECNNLIDYEDLQRICNKLGYILCNITQISNIANVDNNRSCKYLNYLIQEEIENVNSDSNKLPTLYEALKKYKTSYENYKCDFEQNTETDIDIAQTIKQLNYYAEYLYWINENFENIQDTQEDNFSKFLNTFIMLYNRVLRYDTCNQSKKYLTKLNDFKKEYDEALEHIKTKYKDIKPKTMENDEEAAESCTTGKEQDQEGDSEFPLFSSIKSHITTHPAPAAPTHSALGDTIRDDTPEDSNDSTIGKATPFICSGVAIFMFLFILHKFTPLGTCLRKNKLIDRNRMKGKQDDIYKLLSDASQIPHNIAYQPIGY